MVLGSALALEDSWANAVVDSLGAVVANPLKVSFTENFPPNQTPAGTLGGWGELPAAESLSAEANPSATQPGALERSPCAESTGLEVRDPV